ncbi:pilin [Ferrimonas balearica]|uniref:pilin n=1 Tax=Ferrimonas balearica TaxID=44012 RepID=UPI001C9A02E6|nr:pilin [Ferrimonas balearica]MBY5993213.1 pilin [Ferrimonas balearica]
MRRSKGMGLMELVLVVVLLAILAGVALPKLLDLGDDASDVQLKQLTADYRQAVQFAHLRWQTNGGTDRQDMPGYAGDILDMNPAGFPIGIDKGNGNFNIGRGNNGCIALWQTLLEDPPSISLQNDAQFQAYRHNAGAGTGRVSCSYVYRGDGDTRGRNRAARVIQYDSLDGQVALIRR